MPSYYPYPALFYECDTTTYDDGVHNFTAVATDHQGLTSQSTILISFSNIEPQPSNGYSILIGIGAITLMSTIASKRARKKRKLR